MEMMEKSNMRLHKDMHVEKNENLQWMNMSQKHEREKGHQGSFSKSEAINKDSGKRMKNEEGSKCSVVCMYLPCFGFGRSKTVKARKGVNKMNDSVNHVISSTFSLEHFELDDSGVAHGKGIIIQENNHEDESFSSYFDLPSIILKCSADDEA